MDSKERIRVKMDKFELKLQDGTSVWDVLEQYDIASLGDYFKDKNIMGLRVHGLIGDLIKATTVLSELIKENPDRRYIFLVSYNDETKRGLVKEVLTDLINSDKVIGVFFNNAKVIGNITYSQYSFLRQIGCSDISDLYFFDSKDYRLRKKGLPYLGFAQPLPKDTKVALFRYSGFHTHVALRHIPEQSWLLLEDYLLKLGLDVHLYGYDDTMSTLVKPENDHRKKFSVLETIKHSADSGLCISTTTFLPHYLHAFIPCLVFIDPVDTYALNLLWRQNHNFMTINTQLPDYLEFVKNYVSMWYRANVNTKELLRSVSDSFAKNV